MAGFGCPPRIVGRFRQQACPKGSQRWLQWLVNQAPDCLDEQIGLGRIDWRSPLQTDDYAEYRDQAFLDLLGVNLQTRPLRTFWPLGGPCGTRSAGPPRAKSSSSSGNYTLCVDASPVNAGSPKQASVPPSALGWQAGWRYCAKCGVLWMGANKGSKCPGNPSGHVSLGSGNYFLLLRNGAQEEVGGLGQVGWRWCAKCQGLWFTGLPGSKCPADGGAHTAANSGSYIVMNDQGEA
jgi:hypothetical protein